MRIPLLAAGVLAGLVAMNLPANAACNVRGEFCGYPGWAANAFSAPHDRVPEAWLDYPTNPPVYGYVDRDFVKQRYRKRHRSRR